MKKLIRLVNLITHLNNVHLFLHSFVLWEMLTLLLEHL